MTAKAAFSLFEDETITGPVSFDVDVSAYTSGRLIVSSDAGSAGVISYDFVEVDPITDDSTGEQALGSSQNVSPGGIGRFTVALPGVRYRLTAFPQSGSGVLTATLTVVND